MRFVGEWEIVQQT